MRVPGAPFRPYGEPAIDERNVARRISANRAVAGNGIALTPLEDLEGTITPSGLHFERHHGGVPAVDPALHRVLLHGLVRRPLQWSIEALRRYPLVTRQL